ncbi:MAG: ATP-binding cassette domain-containing protein [Gemmatimonadetes bacterium]|nr:ATP-binding cassette domain-containing protein [Gemmatimonadota bacterium]
MTSLLSPRADAGPAIELEGVRKSFDGVDAVRGIDLSVPLGTTYGLLGPNGAGKTTTIRMILRILEPDAGGIRLFGGPVSQRALDRIGYLPEERGLYRKMRLRRVLAFFAELKGMPAWQSRPRIGEWLERLGLADRADARVQELSKGNQQKLQFISAVLHEPELVILDEPFAGLDPINQQVLKEIILDLKRRGRTILFSTHMIEHAERICEHVCIIAQGSKVVDGAIGQVKRAHGGEYVALALEQWAPAAIAAVRSSPLVAHVREQGNEAEVGLRAGADPQELLRALVTAGVRLRRFERVEPSLEQIFLERVGAHTVAEAEAREVSRV